MPKHRDKLSAAPAFVRATPATEAVWCALPTNVPATTPDIASRAGVARNTATRTLTDFAVRGAIIRIPGGRSNGIRQPDQWLLPVADEPNHDAAPDQLARGELRTMIADHLAAHPDRDFTAPMLSKRLRRSAGAIANACQRLTAAGKARQTSTRPRRYQHAA